MTGRHWLRRDVLMPIFYLLLFGALLYWLYGLVRQMPAVAGSSIIQLIMAAIALIYVLLVLITVRHVLSSYDLERYDPGDPASLRRLMRRSRFRLGRNPIPADRLLISLEQALMDKGFRLEIESHQIGRIYQRRHMPGLLTRGFIDRIILLQHEPLNVLTVDMLLQDAIRYIRTNDQPSRRNMMIMVTRMTETQDAASAAAGVVNFLGKFNGGSLCPMLLAIQQNRLFYPADRTLMPRAHRFYQDLLIFRLRKLIRSAQKPITDGPETIFHGKMRQ